ncbi:MAG: glucose 1-dehydrogenase [Desulfobacterales bacterium]
MEDRKILDGQVALVTGASSGIGKTIAEAMGGAGAGVIVNYISDESAANRIVEDIRNAGAHAIAFQADVSREDQVAKMFKAGCDEFGTIDILVNNAGIQKDADFLDMSLADWEAVLNVNLTGCFLCAREAAREFCRRGWVPERSKAAGKIIFISSVHDTIPWAGHTNYAASKGGIMMLMKSIAQELAPHKVRANSISPGAVKTAINRESWQSSEKEAQMRRLIPYDRVGETGDISPVAVWLASDEADYITGATIYVDGGMLLYPGFRTGG